MKKTRLKFNLGLALINLRTTGPRSKENFSRKHRKQVIACFLVKLRISLAFSEENCENFNQPIFKSSNARGSGDCPEDCPEDCSEDCPEDYPEDCPEDYPEDCPEDYPEDCPEDCPEGDVEASNWSTHYPLLPDKDGIPNFCSCELLWLLRK